MADEQKKLTPEAIVKLAETTFGDTVDRATAPGGKARDSMRLHFPGRTIVATQRKYPGRMRLELEVLRRLGAEGVRVPKVLGRSGGVFFQEDMGAARLSGALAAAGDGRRIEIARAAFDSLLAIQEAGKRSGLVEIVPALGIEPGWVRSFLITALAASDGYGIARPVLDIEALSAMLLVSADTFVKWDSRPGNAAIAPDGAVCWFDWEHCGRRHGMEDIAWLAGDEFWPVAPAEVALALDGLVPPDRAEASLDWLAHFTTFHIVQRLALIRKRIEKAGWVDPEKAMRYDKIGVDPGLAKRLCSHGEGWAERGKLARPMAKWFRDCADAIDGLAADKKL